MKRALAILAAVVLMVGIPTAAHAVPVSTVTVNVTMADGGAVPFGLRVEVADPSWTVVANGDLTGGELTASFTGAEPIVFGDYSVWVLGSGYAVGQGVTVDSATSTVTISLTRLTGTVNVTVDTSDSGDLPAGTEWTLTNAGDTIEASGTLSSAIADGGTLSLGAVQYGVYTLSFSSTAYTSAAATVTLTDPWTPSFTVPVSFLAPSSTLALSVNMQDSGPLPYGLTWEIFPNDDSWVAVASGSIPGGATTFTAPDATLPHGSYQVWVSGSGYSSGQVIVFDEATETHSVSLERQTGTITATVETSDGASIPPLSSWRLLDPAGQLIQSGTLVGGSLPLTGALDYGTYTLEVTAVGYAPAVIEAPLTNPWDSTLEVLVTLEALATEATVTITMTDGAALPPGLQWSIIPDGSWEPVATGAITSGATSFSTTVSELDYGTYALWVTGSGYASGWVVVADGSAANWAFEVERQLGSVTATIDTDDDTPLPSGSTWELTDVENTVIQSGVLADGIADGSALPIAAPVQYGDYTLTVSAYGYEPTAIAVGVTDPWNPDVEVTVTVPRAYSTLTVGAHMEDGGGLPLGLTWSLFPAGSWDAIASGSVTAGNETFSSTLDMPLTYGVYQIWITGNGYSSGQVLVIDQPTSSWEFEIVRLFGTVTATINTSDDRAVAAGARWSLSDAQGELVQSGTTSTAILNGDTLPIENPLQYGVYSLQLEAAGYTPVTVVVDLTDPWDSDLVVNVKLTTIPISITPVAPVTPSSPDAPQTIAATGQPVNGSMLFASLTMLFGGLVLMRVRSRRA